VSRCSRRWLRGFRSSARAWLAQRESSPAPARESSSPTTRRPPCETPSARCSAILLADGRWVSEVGPRRRAMARSRTRVLFSRRTNGRSPVRILVATDSWFPDVHGGSARVAAETARRLASRGHEVIVLAPEAKGVPSIETESQLTVLRGLPRRIGPKTLSDMLATRRLAQRGDNFEVLLAHQPTVAWGLAATRKNVPLVLVYHASPVREALLRAEAFPPGPKRVSTRGLAMLLRRVERSVGKRADRVLVLSKYSRGLVELDHPELSNRTVVVSGGVDTDDFSPEPGRDTARAALGVAEDDILLVSIRRLEPRLGLETLLQAFRFLPETRKTRLVIVGDGSRRQALGGLARDLGLEGRL